MKRKDVKIAWACGLDGEIKHVEDVQSGLNCDCICYDCKKPLIAKKGESTRWHFSHAVEADCEGESALHLGAKKALMSAAEKGLHILLPEANGTVALQSVMGDIHKREWKIEKRDLKLQSAEMEKSYQDLIVDVSCNGGSSDELAVEIYVTHEKSDEDIAKFTNRKINSIEIDLSGMVWDASEPQILEAVLNSAPRIWIFNKMGFEALRKAEDELETHIRILDEGYISKYDEAVRNLIESKRFVSLNSYGYFGTSRNQEAGIQEEIIIEDIENVKREDKAIAIIKAKISGGPVIPICIYIGKAGSFYSRKPHLKLVYKPYCDGGIRFYGTWCNVGDWRHKKKDPVRPKSIRKGYTGVRGRSVRLDTPFGRFANAFCNMSDEHKLSNICDRAFIKKPDNPGEFDPAWNTVESVWQNVLLYYSFHTKREEIFSCRGDHTDLDLAGALSVSDFYRSMLGFPMDGESALIRARMIEDRFRKYL